MRTSDCERRSCEAPSGAGTALPRPRSRAFLVTLLALLWASVGCVALVLTTALELESTYEQASAAQAVANVRRPARARAAAGTAGTADGAAAGGAASARAALPADRPQGAEALPGSPRDRMAPDATRPSSRHLGGCPRLGTPQGRRLYEGLVSAARSDADPARRASAVRSLAGMFGPTAAGALAAIAEDSRQPAVVREAASARVPGARERR